MTDDMYLKNGYVNLLLLHGILTLIINPFLLRYFAINCNLIPFFLVTKSKNVLSEFDDLVKDYWSWRLQDNPSFAYEIGVPGYDDRVEQFTLDVLYERYVS